MLVKIGIWGSNCAGKTYVCEIIKKNSKYKVSILNFFELPVITGKKRIQTRKILKILYKTILIREVSFLRRFFWIKPRYEAYCNFFDGSEVFMYEEGLIKKMYEIFPFNTLNYKEFIKMLKKFIYVTPDLLSIEENYVAGFLYVYSDPENIILNMNKRNFFTYKYNKDVLLLRYQAHHLLYSFLISLCQLKGLPVLLIDSYEKEEKIAKKFSIFIESLRMKCQ